VFACIAELFELPDVVCVGVTTRLREDVLSIWNNNNNSNPDIRFIIGEKLRALLNLDETTNVEYKTFRSSIKDKSSFKNTDEYGYIAPPQFNTKPHLNNNNNNNNNNSFQNRTPKTSNNAPNTTTTTTKSTVSNVGKPEETAQAPPATAASPEVKQ